VSEAERCGIKRAYGQLMAPSMSGKSVGVGGSRRGYLLTDESAVREVAALLDAAPPHSGSAFNAAAAAKYPYTLRANAAGIPCTVVLTTVNAVPQCVIVDKPNREGPRRMTCVPIRFDEYLHHGGTVMSAVLVQQPERLLVLEDVLYLCGGRTEDANALERANALHDIVHERHRADPVLQPFRVQCARHLVADGSESRKVFRAYGHAIGSFTLCPMNAGQRDMWHRLRSAPSTRRETGALKGRGRGTVTVLAADIPDVYMAEDGSGPLVVRTIEDSADMLSRARAAGGRAFDVPASYDENARRWVFTMAA
jgi:hypothetical protein